MSILMHIFHLMNFTEREMLRNLWILKLLFIRIMKGSIKLKLGQQVCRIESTESIE